MFRFWGIWGGGAQKPLQPPNYDFSINGKEFNFCLQNIGLKKYPAYMFYDGNDPSPYTYTLSNDACAQEPGQEPDAATIKKFQEVIRGYEEMRGSFSYLPVRRRMKNFHENLRQANVLLEKAVVKTHFQRDFAGHAETLDVCKSLKSKGEHSEIGAYLDLKEFSGLTIDLPKEIHALTVVNLDRSRMGIVFHDAQGRIVSGAHPAPYPHRIVSEEDADFEKIRACHEESLLRQGRTGVHLTIPKDELLKEDLRQWGDLLKDAPDATHYVTFSQVDQSIMKAQKMAVTFQDREENQLSNEPKIIAVPHNSSTNPFAAFDRLSERAYLKINDPLRSSSWKSLMSRERCFSDVGREKTVVRVEGGRGLAR